jgi:hypothetical protein
VNGRRLGHAGVVLVATWNVNSFSAHSAQVLGWVDQLGPEIRTTSVEDAAAGRIRGRLCEFLPQVVWIATAGGSGPVEGGGEIVEEGGELIGETKDGGREADEQVANSG